MSLASDISVKNNSIIEAFPLVAQPAGAASIYLGSRVTDSFLITDDHWQELVNILITPQRVSQIITQLKTRHPQEFTDQNADLKTKVMLLSLIHYNLVKRLDGKPVFGAPPKRIKFKSQSFVTKFIFSSPLLLIISLIALFAIIASLVHPSLRPAVSDFFWHPRFSISFLSMFIASWVFGLGHELSHYLAAQRFGVKARFNLSNRLAFLALETEYPNIYAISRLKRIGVYCAGIIFDLVVIGLVSAAYIWLPQLSWLGLLKQIILVQWIGIFWQFLFYMRTDIYYVIRELTQVENLFTHTQAQLKHLLQPRKSPLSNTLTPTQQKIVGLYTLLYCVGIGLALVRYGMYHVPITLNLITGALHHIKVGLDTSQFLHVADGTIVLSIEIFTFCLLAYAIAKRNLRHFTVFHQIFT